MFLTHILNLLSCNSSNLTGLKYLLQFTEFLNSLEAFPKHVYAAHLSTRFLSLRFVMDCINARN